MWRLTMPRQDRRRWRTARTLADLGELTAQWLEGRISSRPGYEPCCGPEDETAHLVPVLAAANRAGYVTACSQPGSDESVWRQRAGVEGLADQETATSLVDAMGDLVVVAVPVRHWWRRNRHRIPVTTREGKPSTWFGMHLTRGQLAHEFDVCHPAAISALARAWQVTVIDPVWGRDDVLWPRLSRWASDRARTIQTKEEQHQ